MNRPCRPKGAPWISPYLTSRNVEASLDFYERAFGFTKKDTLMSPEGKVQHAEMTFQDGLVMMGAEGAWSPMQAPATSGHPCPINLYVYCEDVDALHARAKAAGAKITGEPQDMFWGDRVCMITDLDGYPWTFATNVGEFDASKMPSK